MNQIRKKNRKYRKKNVICTKFASIIAHQMSEFTFYYLHTEPMLLHIHYITKLKPPL